MKKALIVSGGVIFCVVVAYLILSFFVTRSLHRADCAEISSYYKGWIQAGKPGGEELIKFMQGRRRDLIVTNRIFLIQGTNYFSQFAVTEPKSLRDGTLFITTNGILIWQPLNHDPEIVQFN